MKPALRRLLDGTEAFPGFAIITFAKDTQDPAAPSVLTSTRAATAVRMPPRTVAEGVWRDLESFKQQLEAELGARRFFRLEVRGVALAFTWHAISCRDGDSLFIAASLLEEQLAAERALVAMERRVDLLERMFLGMGGRT